MNEKVKTRSRKKLKIIILIIFAFVLLTVYGIYKIYIPRHYYFFTKSRIEKVEELCMMDLDDVEIVEFKQIWAPTCDTLLVKIKGISDYEDFMKHKFYGVCKKIAPYLDDKWSNCDAVYNCRAGGYFFTICFYKDGDEYYAESCKGY